MASSVPMRPSQDAIAMASNGVAITAPTKTKTKTKTRSHSAADALPREVLLLILSPVSQATLAAVAAAASERTPLGSVARSHLVLMQTYAHVHLELTSEGAAVPLTASVMAHLQYTRILSVPAHSRSRCFDWFGAVCKAEYDNDDEEQAPMLLFPAVEALRLSLAERDDLRGMLAPGLVRSAHTDDGGEGCMQLPLKIGAHTGVVRGLTLCGGMTTYETVQWSQNIERVVMVFEASDREPHSLVQLRRGDDLTSPLVDMIKQLTMGYWEVKAVELVFLNRRGPGAAWLAMDPGVSEAVALDPVTGASFTQADVLANMEMVLTEAVPWLLANGSTVSLVDAGAVYDYDYDLLETRLERFRVGAPWNSAVAPHMADQADQADHFQVLTARQVVGHGRDWYINAPVIGTANAGGTVNTADTEPAAAQHQTAAALCAGLTSMSLAEWLKMPGWDLAVDAAEVAPWFEADK